MLRCSLYCSSCEGYQISLLLLLLLWPAGCSSEATTYRHVLSAAKSPEEQQVEVEEEGEVEEKEEEDKENEKQLEAE